MWFFSFCLFTLVPCWMAISQRGVFRPVCMPLASCMFVSGFLTCVPSQSLSVTGGALQSTDLEREKRDREDERPRLTSLQALGASTGTSITQSLCQQLRVFPSILSTCPILSILGRHSHNCSQDQYNFAKYYFNISTWALWARILDSSGHER